MAALQFIELAGFAQELLKQQKCPYCQVPYHLVDVVAQGNRRGPDGKSYYYYEVHCANCDQPSMTVLPSRPMNTKGLMHALAEHYEGRADASYGSSEDEGSMNAKGEPPSGPQPSKISEEEVQKLKSLLESSQTYEDVLRGLGITEEQLRNFMEQGKQQDAGDEGKS
jgi:hypothetical protein